MASPADGTALATTPPQSTPGYERYRAEVGAFGFMCPLAASSEEFKRVVGPLISDLARTRAARAALRMHFTVVLAVAFVRMNDLLDLLVLAGLDYGVNRSLISVVQVTVL